MIKLYEESEKPEDAVKYLREKMCESCPTEESYNDLKAQYEEILEKQSKLERELSSVKGQM